MLSVYRGLSSLGPLDDRPHARLKASTPHEAPTPALTTKTLAAAYSRWDRANQIGRHLSGHKGGWQAFHRSESTQYEKRSKAERTDLQNYGERESCVVLKALCQHREVTSHPSSQVGAPLLRINATEGRAVRTQDCPGETCSLSRNDGENHE